MPEEREELETIVRKGKHRSQKVLNALILLNCDEQAPTPRTLKEQDIAEVLNVSAMKLYRVKQRFVDEGLEVALNGHKGQRVYAKKADGKRCRCPRGFRSVSSGVLRASKAPPQQGQIAGPGTRPPTRMIIASL